MNCESPERVVRFAPLQRLSLMQLHLHVEDPLVKSSRVTYHNTLRQIGLCYDDSAHLLQQGHENTILSRRLE